MQAPLLLESGDLGYYPSGGKHKGWGTRRVCNILERDVGFIVGVHWRGKVAEMPSGSPRRKWKITASLKCGKIRNQTLRQQLVKYVIKSLLRKHREMGILPSPYVQIPG